MKNALLIKRASPAETEELLTLYIEKVRWLKETGKPLWDESQFTLESLCAKYVNPEFYVGISDNVIVGGFILVERNDEYWPRNANDKAFYFHKFIIRNGYGSLGYPEAILDWVKTYCKQKNKDYLRLDFDETREYVKNMYFANGFVAVERTCDANGKRLIKAEYRIPGSDPQ
jgi:hypothetical protein